MLDLALWMIVGGFVGARLVHVFIYEPQFYFSHPWEFFAVWHGGWSSFGGVAGAIASFFFYNKKHAVAPMQERIADLMSVSAVFGWVVGRLGCVMIHDHLGRPCNCFFDIETPQGPRLDMALTEIFLLLPLVVLFLILQKRRVKDGTYTALLFLYYGITRFLLDFLRLGDHRYLGLTPAQFFAILIMIFGGHFLFKRYWKDRIAV